MSGLPINPLVLETAGPAILETRAWLESYDGSKGPPIDLSQAAPPYAPPQELLDHLSAAAASAELARYGAVPGELALRTAYAHQVSQLYGVNISPQHISITGGCNQAFVIAAMLVAQRGDAIILPVPWYFNHKMTLDMLGIETRPLPCLPSANFMPDVSAMLKLIDNNVRALVLVTPNNPTGAIYSPAAIEAFAAACREHGIWLILDETYRDFLPGESQRPHALFEEPYRSGVIGLYSFSKSLAIPGYRLGAMIYPPGLSGEIVKVQDCVQICASRVGQVGVAWALGALQDWRHDKRQMFIDKARDFRAAMARIEGWQIDSIGGYFAYMRHPFGDTPAAEVAKRLATENGLLLIPGSYFGPGQEQHLRVSFGNLPADGLSELPERFRI
jgi:aspartate/methionine/tyrosine aminotransferase